MDGSRILGAVVVAAVMAAGANAEAQRAGGIETLRLTTSTDGGETAGEPFAALPARSARGVFSGSVEVVQSLDADLDGDGVSEALFSVSQDGTNYAVIARRAPDGWRAWGVYSGDQSELHDLRWSAPVMIDGRPFALLMAENRVDDDGPTYFSLNAVLYTVLDRAPASAQLSENGAARLEPAGEGAVLVQGRRRRVVRWVAGERALTLAARRSRRRR